MGAIPLCKCIHSNERWGSNRGGDNDLYEYTFARVTMPRTHEKTISRGPNRCWQYNPCLWAPPPPIELVLLRAYGRTVSEALVRLDVLANLQFLTAC